jgi:hypothetical protein
MLVFQFILTPNPDHLFLVTPSAERISMLPADAYQEHVNM